MTRVLVADDDRDNRELAVAVLGAIGIEAVTVTTGDAALTAARERAFDAALLDVRMPGLTGLEVCRALRQEGRDPTMPILLISACAAPEEISSGLAAGADDYLVKPFRIGELTRRVVALLATAQPAAASPRPVTPGLLAALSTRTSSAAARRARHDQQAPPFTSAG